MITPVPTEEPGIMVLHGVRLSPKPVPGYLEVKNIRVRWNRRSSLLEEGQALDHAWVNPADLDFIGHNRRKEWPVSWESRNIGVGSVIDQPGVSMDLVNPSDYDWAEYIVYPHLKQNISQK